MPILLYFVKPKRPSGNCVVKAIILQGVRSPWSRLLENDCAVCTRPKGHLISEGHFGVIISTKKPMNFLKDFCPNL